MSTGASELGNTKTAFYLGQYSELYTFKIQIMWSWLSCLSIDMQQSSETLHVITLDQNATHYHLSRRNTYFSNLTNFI